MPIFVQKNFGPSSSLLQATGQCEKLKHHPLQYNTVEKNIIIALAKTCMLDSFFIADKFLKSKFLKFKFLKSL